MSEIITKEIKQIIEDKNTLKAISTVDKNGIPHVVFKGSIHINEDGNIEFYEVLESSKNNQNLVYALWFGKKVAINILSSERRSFEIVGKPILSLTSGKKFQEAYIKLRERFGDNGELGSIWIIEPEQIRNETLSVRQAEDEAEYPILKHVDRLLKDEYR